MECKAEGRHGRDQDKMPDAMEPEVDEPETDAGAAPDGPAAAAPNNTIYIRNINEKLKKEDLKQQLDAGAINGSSFTVFVHANSALQRAHDQIPRLLYVNSMLA